MLSLSDNSGLCSPNDDALRVECAKSSGFACAMDTPIGVAVIELARVGDERGTTTFLFWKIGRPFTRTEGPAASGRGKVSGMEWTLKRCKDTWWEWWNDLLGMVNEAK